MPWANVFFRKKTLVRAGYELLNERGDRYRPMELRPADALWTLNGATIRSTQRILRSLNAPYTLRLSPLFSPLVERWDSWRMRYYGWAFNWLRFLPGLREMFTHRMVLVLTKPAN